MASNQEKGSRGEAIAAEYLEARGYRVVERNYRAKGGEIDLICRHEEHGIETVVFVEVKLRRTMAYGAPEEAVDPRKLAKMEVAADHYLHEHRLDDARCRFDVVGILATHPPRIRHFKDAT
ncbi:MAG: YraN family protein [Rhodothermales bacterium]